MASINGSTLGNNLQGLLMCPDIQPGDAPSYQLCKTLSAYHPLGLKMARTPVVIAQSQARVIAIANAEDDVKEAFEKQWELDHADDSIRAVVTTARVYGIASVGVITQGVTPNQPLDRAAFYKDPMIINVFDPLNTAGSMVLNLDPLAPNFLKPTNVVVNGIEFHHTRTCAVLNEDPIYLEYTTSAFGFVGRSVYQRALFPLKSFINSMRADDMVTRKAGLLVAKMKSPGSIIDNAMQAIFGQKRALLQQAETDNVLGIDVDESVETLDMKNVNGAMKESRDNILKNIAVAADMPAKMLDNETFVEGFGEGTEDAKNVARYVESVRKGMTQIYKFFDDLIMLRAWNPDFVKAMQAKYPDHYSDKSAEQIVMEWRNAFRASWPSLLKEPESEEIKVADVKFRALLSAVEIFLPMLDPTNQCKLLQWASETFNDMRLLFPTSLELDWDELEDFLAEKMQRAEQLAQQGDNGDPDSNAEPREPKEPRPFAAQDAYKQAIGALMQDFSSREHAMREHKLRSLKLVGG